MERKLVLKKDIKKAFEEKYPVKKLELGNGTLRFMKQREFFQAVKGCRNSFGRRVCSQEGGAACETVKKITYVAKG